MDIYTDRKHRLVRFLSRQINQVRQGGIGIVPHKITKAATLLLMLPFFLFIRLIRPWLILRFAPLYSERIGHFAVNTEVYLCERDAGMYLPSRRFIDIFYYNSPVCNSQLRRMWDRILHVCPLDISSLDRLNRWLPGGEEHIIRMPHRDRDIHGLLAGTSPHLSWTPNEERKGREGLAELGMPEDIPFVCFHARDSAYLETIYPNDDCSYHDYRDSKICNYILAAEELTRRGYYAIRMGSVVKEALHTSNPKIIDYATNGHRTEFMDVFLGARCRFFISNATGAEAVSVIFRRPLMRVNFVPLEYAFTWFPDHIFIPKKHWLRDERRFMTFREILESGAGRFLFREQYERAGIELIENTPEEIADVVIEMDDRLKGVWQTTEEDEEMQRRFWSLFKPSELHGQLVSRIGAKFLRQHDDWLE